MSTALLPSVSHILWLCTGFGLFFISLRRRLSVHDDDAANSFWTTWLAQRNFLAHHGSQLGHIWSV